MKIAISETDNTNLLKALKLTKAEIVKAENVNNACELVKSAQADFVLAGADLSSRDVILAARDCFGIAKTTFSGLAVMQKEDKTYLLADMAACKHPTLEQLVEIILQTVVSAYKILGSTPRVALLSFSTLGSGGKDNTITLLTDTKREIIRICGGNIEKPDTLLKLPDSNIEFAIDGEMQLDAAINPQIGVKKAPNSSVAGRANILIAPDLNSGNLIYKTFEQIGGYTVAGPILQGFNYPISDLSRGSTVEDIVLTIKSMQRLAR